jgi:hypothetical protein
MANRIVIDVVGIDDPSVVAAIEETIRQSFSQRALPGLWRVHIGPSCIQGEPRWDLNVHGLDARHTVSIAVPASLLPELVPVRLRESLDRLCSAHVSARGDCAGSNPAIRTNETLSA